jgi:hypothetical protein
MSDDEELYKLRELADATPGYYDRALLYRQIIAGYAGDDEVQHMYEDRLKGLVVSAVLEASEEAILCARIALEVGAMDFSRWCA